MFLYLFIVNQFGENLLFRRKQNTIIHIKMRAVSINKDTTIPIYIPGVDEVSSFETLK